MKIKTSLLKLALSHLKPLFGGRANSMIYASNVKLETKRGNLELTATNLDEWAVEWPLCEGDFGPVCVNFNHLNCCLGGEEVEITMDGSKVKITYGEAVRRLSCVDADTFPALPEVDTRTASGITMLSLQTGIIRTKFATMDPKGTVPVLENIHVFADAGKLTIEAANGPCCSWYFDEVKKSEKTDILIPRAFADSVESATGRPNGEMSIADASLTISHDEGFYRCKLAEGKFTNLKPVWDTLGDEIGEVESAKLLPILGSIMSLCPDGKYPPATLRFSPIGIAIESIGDTDVKDLVEGSFSEFTAHINCRVVIPAINNLKSEKVLINQAGKSLVFQSGKCAIFCGGMKGPE